jgi:ketosteroid isomerase-like protein
MIRRTACFFEKMLFFMKKMLFFVLFCFPMFLFAQSRAVKKVTELEKKRFEAMVNLDFVALREMLGDDLRYTHSNGKFESKAEYLTEITDGTLRYQRMEPTEIDVRIFKKTAVVTGLVFVSVKQGDRIVESQLRYTDVWQKRSGKWQLVVWQSVRIP